MLPSSFTLPPQSCVFTDVDQGYRTKPVPYSLSSARLVQIEVQKCLHSPDPLTYVYPRIICDTYGNEIKRFSCALYAYLTSHKPILSEKFLLDGIIDIDFAKLLKRIRMACLSKSWDLLPLEDDGLDDLREQYRHQKMCDIGQVFNYKYWFFWEEPDPEDWKYARIPLDVDPQVVSEFEAIAREVLPKSFAEVYKQEVILELSSSSAIDEHGLKTSVIKEKGRPNRNIFSRDPLKGYLTTVRKCPTEVRNAITLSVPQSNTVKWIEKQCAEVCRNMKTSAYGLSPEDFEKKLEKFWGKNTYFLNREDRKSVV